MVVVIVLTVLVVVGLVVVVVVTTVRSRTAEGTVCRHHKICINRIISQNYVNLSFYRRCENMFKRESN